MAELGFDPDFLAPKHMLLTTMSYDFSGEMHEEATIPSLHLLLDFRKSNVIAYLTLFWLIFHELFFIMYVTVCVSISGSKVSDKKHVCLKKVALFLTVLLYKPQSHVSSRKHRLS